MISIANVTINESILNVITTEGTTPIVSDGERNYIESSINMLIFVFASLGVVTNAINIRVFIQQGLSSDSNTIGLFALAMADFFGCFTLLPNIVCDIFRYAAGPDKVLTCTSLSTLLFHIPHVGSSRITCWITVYIAVERSLCVLIPFKVKALIRPKVTIVSMVVIYVIFIALYVPLYMNLGIAWRFRESLNATVAMITETEMGSVILAVYGVMLNTVLTIIAIAIIAVTTGLMLYKLNKYKKWRMQASAQVKDNNPASQQSEVSQQKKKDVEVLKTVVTITGLFLACLSVSQLPGIASSFVPGFTLSGLNRNLYYILYFYKFLFDVVNSSLNFFFYIRISSRYKTAFNEVFRKSAKKY